MRWFLIAFMCLTTPVFAQDETGLLERLFGTDTAASDAEQGSLLERLIEDSLSGAGRSVTVTGFRGALSGQATLDSLVIADADGPWLTLTDARLDWNRAALFAGRLEVTEIFAAEILVPRMPVSTEIEAPSPEARGFQLPDLPVSVNIGRIAAERVHLGEALFGVAAVISLDGALSLADGEGAADLEILRLDQPGQIKLDSGYQNSTETLRLDLGMIEEEGGIVATLAGLPGAPSVDFAVQGEGPLSEFTADIRLATDGAERLSGQISTGQAEQARRIRASLGGDIAPVFAPQFRDFFGDTLALEADVLLYQDGRKVLPEFSLFARELALFGSVEIGADNLPQKIDVTGRIAPETGQTVLLPLGGAPTEVARANLIVQFDAEKSENYTAAIRLESLSLEGLSAQDILLRTTGRIGSGIPAEILGELEFDVSGLVTNGGLSDALGSNIAGDATLGWSGGPVTINRFTLNARDLNAQGAASIDSEALRTTASLTATRLSNFAGLADRPLSGEARLNVEATLNPLTQEFDVTAEGETVDLAIGDARADAILAGTASLDVTAVRDSEGIRIDLRELESSEASLAGEAALRSGGSSANIDGELASTALVLPGVEGATLFSFSGQEDERRDWTIATTLAAPSLDAEVMGLFSNIYDEPSFQGTLSASSPNIATYSQMAGRSLSGALSIEAEGGINADLTRALVNGTIASNDLSIDDPRIDPLLRGNVALTLDASRMEDRVDIRSFSLEGTALTAEVAGVVTELTGTTTFEGTVGANVADLSVLSPLADRRLSGQVELQTEVAVSRDLSLLRLDGAIGGDTIAIGIAEIDRLLSGPVSLSLNAGRDGETIEVSSFTFKTDALSAETSGRFGEVGERLTLVARLNDVAPFVAGFSGALSIDGTVGQSGELVALDIDAVGPGGTEAAISGTLAADASRVDLAIDGTATLALANRFIAPRTLAGTSRFNLRLNGQPSPQNLSGTVSLIDGRLAAPTLPSGLQGIEGSIALNSGSANLNVNARVESGGRLTVAGPIVLNAPNTAELRVNLDAVRITDPQLYETLINGQIEIEGPLTGGAAINGALMLGETNIQIPSSGLGGAGTIPEITHLREPPQVRSTRRKAGLLDQDSEGQRGTGPAFPLDIRVSAPNRIFVRGRGLDSEFAGALQLLGTTNNVTPSGAFELIRGRLDILGNRLALEEATIAMQGGFIPILNIRASTDVEDAEVNVEVLGRADNPEIRFTSAPELPQEEILSRLIFGRGLESLSPIQAARLAVAVRTLAGRGGEGIVGNIRGTAGLADLDVTTNEDGNAAVRAGAYLGENVYSDVTVDSAGETTLNLNLDVSPSLTVRGGASNEGDSSLGIFFERDY